MDLPSYSAAPLPQSLPAESDHQAQRGASPAAAGPSGLSRLITPEGEVVVSQPAGMALPEIRERVAALLGLITLRVDMTAEGRFGRKAFEDGQELLRRLS